MNSILLYLDSTRCLKIFLHHTLDHLSNTREKKKQAPWSKIMLVIFGHFGKTLLLNINNNMAEFGLINNKVVSIIYTSSSKIIRCIHKKETREHHEDFVTYNRINETIKCVSILDRSMKTLNFV